MHSLHRASLFLRVYMFDVTAAVLSPLPLQARCWALCVAYPLSTQQLLCSVSRVLLSFRVFCQQQR